MIQLVGNWDEFRTPTRIPCGSISGYLTKIQRPLVRRLYFVPAVTGLIKDADAKYYTVLRLPSRPVPSRPVPRRVGQIISANPSTLVGLAHLGDEHKKQLIRDIADGTLCDDFDVPASVRSALAPMLKRPNPHCARALEAIVDRTGTLYPRDYWPTLSLVGNWIGGTVGRYLREYSRLFGRVPVRDIGLMASETRVTIPPGRRDRGGRARCLPSLLRVYPRTGASFAPAGRTGGP